MKNQLSGSAKRTIAGGRNRAQVSAREGICAQHVAYQATPEGIQPPRLRTNRLALRSIPTLLVGVLVLLGCAKDATETKIVGVWRNGGADWHIQITFSPDHTYQVGTMLSGGTLSSYTGTGIWQVQEGRLLLKPKLANLQKSFDPSDDEDWVRSFADSEILRLGDRRMILLATIVDCNGCASGTFGKGWAITAFTRMKSDD